MSFVIDVEALPHQLAFMRADKRYVCLSGGLGSGKSWGLGLKGWNLARINAGFDGLLVSHTAKQLRKLQVEVEDVFRLLKTDFKKRGSDEYHFTFDGKPSILYTGTCFNKAYEQWAGGNMAYVIIDEIDTMDDAELVWKYANDRVRVKAPLLQTACASTPEGFKFLWRYFEQDILEDPKLAKHRQLIHGSTFDNIHIDRASYIRNLMQTRDPRTLLQYLEGKFVNMDGVLVYSHFDPHGANHSPYTIETIPQHVKVAHIGMDFNVVNTEKHPYGIVACLGVILENGELHIIDECYGESKTTDTIAKMTARWGNRFSTKFVYPDPSGKQERTSSEESDRIQLRNAGYEDQSPNGNPRVKDRIASVNNAILNTDGWSRLRVNPAICPVLTSCLQRQAYDKRGDPQKDTGLDDFPDALGYLINVKFPMVIKSSFAESRAWRQ